VKVLEIHAAPTATGNRASVSALTDSLMEISDWDWHGARIVLEHCDAFTTGRSPAKGFMPLEAEAEAVNLANDRSGRSIGVAINWARSVIEQRRPKAALEHLTFLRNAGLLGGFVLSGCSDVDTRYGPAWADVHIPPALNGAHKNTHSNASLNVLEPASLMTGARIRECLVAAGTDAATGFRGIKVAAGPGARLDERVATIAQTLDIARKLGRL
jgi:hypothetical protein